MEKSHVLRDLQIQNSVSVSQVILMGQKEETIIYECKEKVKKSFSSL